MKKGLSYYQRALRWRWLHSRPPRDLTLETKNGLLSFSNKDWLIGKHLFVRREYEFDFINDTVDFLRRVGLLNEETNNTVADVGANIGMISIALVRQNLFQKALAFEPSPGNFRLLEKNVRQNDLGERIKCFQYALSSENKKIELELAEENSGDCRVRTSGREGAMGEHRRETVPVDARTFDDFLASNEAGAAAADLDLVWMDIQGHEGHFFKGAREFFKDREVPCVCEFWGYGIDRSGMTQDEYCETLGGLFAGFYHLTADGGYRLRPIAEIKTLFDDYKNPRHISNIILIGCKHFH